MAHFLLLKFSLCQGYNTLQVYGDSILVINHVSGNVQLHNINLWPLVDHIHEIIVLFVHIEFSHIFMELNQMTSNLSKEGTLLLDNQIILPEFDDGKTPIQSQFMLQDS